MLEWWNSLKVVWRRYQYCIENCLIFPFILQASGICSKEYPCWSSHRPHWLFYMTTNADSYIDFFYSNSCVSKLLQAKDLPFDDDAWSQQFVYLASFSEILIDYSWNKLIQIYFTFPFLVGIANQKCPNLEQLQISLKFIADFAHIFETCCQTQFGDRYRAYSAEFAAACSSVKLQGSLPAQLFGFDWFGRFVDAHRCFWSSGATCQIFGNPSSLTGSRFARPHLCSTR